MTREEVLSRATQLAQEGHTLLVVDDPERAMLGYMAFLMSDGEDQSEILEWPLFDGPLEPDKAETTPEELARFLAVGPSVALCDDPKRRCLGFVRYDPEHGRSVVRQTRLTHLKGADAETRSTIMGLHDALLGEVLKQRETRQINLTP